MTWEACRRLSERPSECHDKVAGCRDIVDAGERAAEHFPTTRVQLIGRAEVGYLLSLDGEVRFARLEQYAQLGGSPDELTAPASRAVGAIRHAF